ncbi:MAG: KUP/HAK/KT family potassium transporter [Thermodesulfobacteriaceae bacterium]|nr:KUP/HAK/KT family potassium transporter [Thermodesulfobacteriaceae bacterium]MCX8042156.1 KUP/HAK/KT family potassium transporter [Thermodesulfobacteriaceae bacterium]MDW8135423.1 KUP/HAK/KT family potassium transporter [Thermodesulfobacterium sp.]
MQKIIKAIGLVFGDIGTSPIYTLSVVFLLLPATYENILGVLSIIFWTMVIIPTLQYMVLAMSLSLRGEGGTFVLAEIFKSLIKSKRGVGIINLISFMAISLLMGDGVITPAISILSAVEGISLIPGLTHLSETYIVGISIIIATFLFYFQSKGTERVSSYFGPVIGIWFLSLFILGLIYILKVPGVLKAINPLYGIDFLLNQGWKGFLVLGEIILCATGSEAMYADMGHLGANPIKQAWKIGFVALIVNYFGQGAFLFLNPEAKYVLFEMCLQTHALLYIPFLILALFATVIASQAMISAMFSLVYQAMSARILPLVKVKYTSTELSTQIYIGIVNWILYIAVCLVMYHFSSSHKLAAAYGLAVTATMTITGLFLIFVFYLQKKFLSVLLSIFTFLVCTVYFSSTWHKFLEGGYWSILLATFPFLLILLYTQGQKALYRNLTFLNREEFIHKFSRFYPANPKIQGTALFFIREPSLFPPYVMETLFFHGILYEENIFISIIRKNEPFGITAGFLEELCPGAKVFQISHGYMEYINVENILREHGINERAIFYGFEDIKTENPVWKLYAFIKQASPHFVKFLELPSTKLHGVITRLEM